MVKKGTAIKKATVTQKLESGVRAKIVALRPSTITNRTWIYAASPAERLAEWEVGLQTGHRDFPRRVWQC